MSGKFDNKSISLMDMNDQIGKVLDSARNRSAAPVLSAEGNKRTLKAMREHAAAHPPKGTYVVRGAVMRCRCGTHQRRLNLPLSHGVFCGGHPVIHGLDCEVGDDKNISSFGICQEGTIKNSEKIRLEKEVLDENGLAIPGKTDGVVSRQKCAPVILKSWMATHSETRITRNGGSKDNPADQKGSGVGFK